MRYGFIIDNRKCIGCHACTVACKSEHDVAIGVNRTYVKQVEKGTFPDTRRIFSVMRCNHCTDAPCTTICPTSALFTREDGIVDFDNNRCIGCKSCMQACPYDALYIDPDTHTAAKCNYCAHRIDIGLEPACVNVCPEHAIISGNMDNPESEIAKLLSREQVMVRKPEKATYPNLFYINGDESSLNPSVTERTDNYIWNSQATGVGHFSKFAEALAKGKDLLTMAQENEYKSKNAEFTFDKKELENRAESQAEGIMKSVNPKRVYDTPDKGILWGWEVSGYLWTKSISAGLILVPFIISLIFGFTINTATMWITVSAISLIFLTITGALLVMDLDQPKRFIFVLLRPQFSSWLVKGGYSISIFGAAVSGILLGKLMDWDIVFRISFWVGGVISVIVAIYTAFLFAQAKGRDFWQSPTLAIHMLVQSMITGSASIILIYGVMQFFREVSFATISEYAFVLNTVVFMLVVLLIMNAFIILVEMITTHPTKDAKRVVQMILKGRYKMRFWIGSILVGIVIPLILILLVSTPYALFAACILILTGSLITEKIWVEAPQRIPLT